MRGTIQLDSTSPAAGLGGPGGRRFGDLIEVLKDGQLGLLTQDGHGLLAEVFEEWLVVPRLALMPSDTTAK